MCAILFIPIKYQNLHLLAILIGTPVTGHSCIYPISHSMEAAQM